MFAVYHGHENLIGPRLYKAVRGTELCQKIVTDIKRCIPRSFRSPRRHLSTALEELLFRVKVKPYVVEEAKKHLSQKHNLERIETRSTLLTHFNEPMKRENVRSSR